LIPDADQKGQILDPRAAFLQVGLLGCVTGIRGIPASGSGMNRERLTFTG